MIREVVMNKSVRYRDQVINLYKDGLSITKISKFLGISQPTVSKIIKSAGIEIRKDNYSKLDIDEENVNSLYQEGLSTYKIAERLGCSDETIRKLIDNVRTESQRNIKTAETKEKLRDASKRNWQDPEYVKKVENQTKTAEYKLKLSNAAKSNYEKTLGNWVNNNRDAISLMVKDLWKKEEYREKVLAAIYPRMSDLVEASKRSLQDPNKRAAWIEKIRKNNAERRTNEGFVSSAQKQLYYLLKHSGIEFYEEGASTKIGPFYVVDCVIPVQQSMQKPLIIEVQGEYWHSLPHVVIKDRQKESYIYRHTDYNLIQLKELHLKSFDEVKHQLSAFGLTLNETKCSVHDLSIKIINEADASLFYSTFHYSCTIRKGAQVFGAYYNDELVAAISYCHPIRQQVASRLGIVDKDILEISRMARKTNLVCKNLLSYLISYSRKQLPENIKCIISYSDSTYNHSGSVYKASGFTFDGIVEPDYHYISLNGRYHKKTIWDNSKRMKMTEREYAEKHNLLKVYGKSKSRWIYRIS